MYNLRGHSSFTDRFTSSTLRVILMLRGVGGLDLMSK